MQWGIPPGAQIIKYSTWGKSWLNTGTEESRRRKYLQLSCKICLQISDVLKHRPMVSRGSEQFQDTVLNQKLIGRSEGTIVLLWKPNLHFTHSKSTLSLSTVMGKCRVWRQCQSCPDLPICLAVCKHRAWWIWISQKNVYSMCRRSSFIELYFDNPARKSNLQNTRNIPKSAEWYYLKMSF